MSEDRWVLDAQDVRVTFGGVVAVDHVTVRVGEAEIVGVIGPNGSGKTSLLNALTGVVSAKGAVSVRGEEVRLGTPEASRRAGLVRMFQAPQIFHELDCIDNAMVSPADRHGTGVATAWFARPWMRRCERSRAVRAQRWLEFVGLGGRERQPSSSLTYGQARLLELARALAGEPTVLMLDEPSAGLNDAETARLADLLRRVQQEGTAIVLIDHKIDFVDSLCDRLVVLELGSVIAEGAPSEVWAHERVRNAYLGVIDDA